MKKKIELIILLIIVVGGSFGYAHIDKGNIIYDKNYDDSEYTTVPTLSDGSLTQTFTAPEDKLDGVRAKMIITGDISNVTLQYTITELESGKAYTGSVPGTEIKNGKYYFFRTNEQISGCMGKEYTIEIKEQGATDTQGVGFYMTPTTNNGTSLDINGESREGTVIMRAVTHRFDIETFVVLLVCILFIGGFMRVLYGLFNK